MLNPVRPPTPTYLSARYQVIAAGCLLPFWIMRNCEQWVEGVVDIQSHLGVVWRKLTIMLQGLTEERGKWRKNEKNKEKNEI